MTKLYAPIILFSLASCSAQVKYLGSTYPETQNVDVYVSQAAVNNPFDIIGKGYIMEGVGKPSVEVIQRKAMMKAKENGANAVVIEDYYVVDNTSSILTKSDSSGKRMVQTSPTLGKDFTILFLKYK